MILLFVVLDSLDSVFGRILLRMVWLCVFGLDAVFPEDIVPCVPVCILKLLLCKALRIP